MTLRSDELVTLATVLDEALELSEDARADWLEGLVAPHAQMRPLLRSLLDRHAADPGAGLLDTLPKFGSLDADLGPHGVVAGLTEGATIGPYRLIREIGHGGMSVVWLATRADEQLKRSVALKLPFVALDRGRFAQRFARERDILAALTHPQIGRLYDAGISAEGQPYLAMEFVQGTPLLEHCDHLKLNIRARLSLFGQVLSAVQYAHSHLVVHRDLKPSNILVTAQNHVVLLDFGIAKLLGEGAGVARETQLTFFDGRALTPDYASPEQISGEALGTTSDIYSLGVVLYELLTGSRPYRLKRDSRGALEDAILDVEPVPPSRLITPAAADLRGAPPRQLARTLRGDLDTILLKALGKRPEDRYPTADAFAQELQRYSRGEPIQARAARPWYRARKFLLRNKLTASLSGALLVALVAGLGTALWEAHAARVEARRAQNVQQFLVGIFSQSDPEHARGKNITAGEILERGAARLDSELRDEPRMLGELHHVISDIYSALGDNVDGLVHAERAVALLARTGRQGSPEYLDSLSLRAQSFDEEEKWDQSKAAYEELRRAAHEALGSDTAWEVTGLRGLAWAATEEGQLKEAKQLYDEALRIALRVAGERSVPYLKTLGSSVQADLDLGLLEDAQAAAVKVTSLGPLVPGYALTDLLVDRYQLALILYRKRNFEQSLGELNHLVPDMDRHIGTRHDRTIKARSLRAQALAEVGDFKQALAEERINIESTTISRAGDPEQFALQELTFAKILRGANRFDEGVATARSGLTYFDAKYSSPTVLRERGRWVLGDLLVASGQLSEGIDALTAALHNMQTLQGSGQTPVVADAFLSLGNAYRLRGESSAAADHFAAACRIYEALLGADSQSTLRCRIYRLLVMRLDGRPSSDLKKSHEAFVSLHGRLASLLAPRHPLLAELDIMESDYLSKMGQGMQATPLREKAMHAYEEATGLPPPLPLRFLH